MRPASHLGRAGSAGPVVPGRPGPPAPPVARPRDRDGGGRLPPLRAAAHLASSGAGGCSIGGLRRGGRPAVPEITARASGWAAARSSPPAPATPQGAVVALAGALPFPTTASPARKRSSSDDATPPAASMPALSGKPSGLYRPVARAREVDARPPDAHHHVARRQLAQLSDEPRRPSRQRPGRRGKLAVLLPPAERPRVATGGAAMRGSPRIQ